MMAKDDLMVNNFKQQFPSKTLRRKNYSPQAVVAEVRWVIFYSPDDFKRHALCDLKGLLQFGLYTHWSVGKTQHQPQPTWNLLKIPINKCISCLWLKWYCILWWQPSTIPFIFVIISHLCVTNKILKNKHSGSYSTSDWNCMISSTKAVSIVLYYSKTYP